MRSKIVFVGATGLLLMLITLGRAAEPEVSDPDKVLAGPRSPAVKPQSPSVATPKSGEAVVVGTLKQAYVVDMWKSNPPIYRCMLHISVGEVLRGEVKVGTQLQLGHSATQLLPPEYPVGKRVLVTVRFGGGDRVHSIALATDEALATARASAIAADKSISAADQDGADQPATAPESKPESDSKRQTEPEGRSQ